eukprot:8788267-Lingulodinium_polyedra.AAC.1
MPEKRSATINYRGIDLDLRVHSWHEEFDLRMMTVAKAWAVQKGLLEGFFCEAELLRKASQ